QHIALIAIVALVAASWAIWLQNARGYYRGVLIGGVVIAVALLTVQTFQRARLFADPIVLYEATLAENPDCWLLHNNLGSEMYARGCMEGALNHYEQAVQINPDYPEAQVNLGFMLARAGERSEAMSHYARAIESNPDYVQAHFNLADALLQTGQA